MLPRRRTATLAVSALALVLVPGTPAGAADPVAVITMAGEGGTYLDDYKNAVFAGADVHVTLGADTTRDEITLRTDPTRSPDGLIQIRAATGAPRLEVGTYTLGEHFDETLPHVLTWFGDHYCTGPAGTLDVLDLTRDASGTLTSLAAEVTRTGCHGLALSGRWSLRWSSTVPYQHTTTTTFAAGDVVGGRTVDGTLTITNAGSGSQTYGASTIPVGNPEFAGIASLVSDGCAGRTLTSGQTCPVTVRFSSDGQRSFNGWLRTPEQGGQRVAFSRITMTGVPAPTTPGVDLYALRGGIRLTATSSAAQKFRVLRSVDGGPESEVAYDVAMPWTDMGLSASKRYTYRVRSVSGSEVSEPSAPVTGTPLALAQGNDGEFMPIDPVRVLDTRTGLGAPAGRLAGGHVLTFDPALGDAIPRSGVSAVLLNVTGTEPTEATHVRVWPSGAPLPDTSSLNLVPGQSRPNQVVVPVGADGRVALYNQAGYTHLIVDVQGFYSTADGEEGGGYHPLPSTRILDTRAPEWDGHVYPLGPGEEIWLPVEDLTGSWPSAVDVNLTVTQPTRAGHLIAWPGDGEAPNVSNVNFAPGQTVPNHAVIPVTYDGDEPGIAIRNNTDGTAHLVVDLQGWYDDGSEPEGLRYKPSTTTRAADTRAGRGPVAPGDTLVVPSSALPRAVAHVVNVTATQSTGPGHLIAWSGDGAVPGTSVVNFERAEDSPNLATVPAGAGGAIAVTAGTSNVHVIVDHLGFFY